MLFKRRKSPQSKNPSPKALSFDDGELDYVFYKTWYVDLQSFDNERLLRHWRDFGRKEQRYSSFEELLKSRNLDSHALPRLFDWRFYIRRNPDLAETVVSHYHAVAHYLEYGRSEQRECGFDHEFYIGYYKDVVSQVADREGALNHWLEHGQVEGRATSFADLLKKHGFSIDILPSDFDSLAFFEKHSAILQSYGQTDPWNATVWLLRMEPVFYLPVSSKKSSNLEFYRRLALHHETIGAHEKAEDLYQVVLNLNSDDPVALENLGNIGLRGGQWKRAIQYYQKAMDTKRESSWAWGNRAQALAAKYDWEEAIQTLHQGFLRHPDQSHLEHTAKRILNEFWDATSKTINQLARTNGRTRLIGVTQAAVRQIDGLWERVVRRVDDIPYQGRVSRGHVLIVGDFFLPQCRRYRIEQKREQLEAAGYNVAAIPWNKAADASNALPFYDQIIFYRVPALPEIVRLIAVARALGKVVFYEIDDLIFDPVYPPSIDTYGGYVNAEEYANLVKGMALYRAAAQLCDYGLASTQPLADRLAPLVRSGKCFLHRNALDKQNYIPASAPEPVDKGYLNLFYGSGTKAHNSDFIEEVLPAIRRILNEFPETRLTVVGYLQLPTPDLEKFGGRIVQIPLVENIKVYWSYVAASDINLAVLKPDLMTDVKSELKWLEAGVFAVPSVVSNTQNYIDVIKNDVDGVTASGPDEWYEALSRLIRDPALRRRVGLSARMRILKEYSVSTMAKNIDAILDEATDMHEASLKAVSKDVPAK